MTQNQAIKAHLESGKALDPLTALEKFGCFRLAARVEELRGAGLPIKAVIVNENGKRFARYRLGR